MYVPDPSGSTVLHNSIATGTRASGSGTATESSRRGRNMGPSPSPHPPHPPSASIFPQPRFLRLLIFTQHFSQILSTRRCIVETPHPEKVDSVSPKPNLVSTSSNKLAQKILTDLIRRQRWRLGELCGRLKGQQRNCRARYCTCCRRRGPPCTMKSREVRRGDFSLVFFLRFFRFCSWT